MSDLTEDFLNALDAAADFATIVSASKPAMRVIKNRLPINQLKYGDQYQESSLKLLEASVRIMPPDIHESLNDKYDEIKQFRDNLYVKHGLWQRRHAISSYKNTAKKLNCDMQQSSRTARSQYVRITRTKIHKSYSGDDAAAGVSSETNEVAVGTSTSASGTAETDITDLYRREPTNQSSVYLISNPFRETSSVIVHDERAAMPEEEEDYELDDVTNAP
ncbi:uncharacterized protein LAESUDRAFT_721326 [Laetiporus sulphureus 93-53]|uniref:Uncharacterized protein n=1 Tax=Laetiporus sulphureus 93-53 TaxID=1314785 RepID=A0A165GWJ4_9APHY|nr:uncharacterized protein LAESUDRAFT_721326 [Laetiporus sulphureus 93-53]KZT10923.1 hypothetical protein LAESUDRAFT_721326 [Laetiporus sulphureus 93-53]